MTANVAGAAIQNFRIGPSLSNRIGMSDSNSNWISKLHRSLIYMYTVFGVDLVKFQCLLSPNLFDVFNVISNRKAVHANWRCHRDLLTLTWLVFWAPAHLAILNAWAWRSLTWPVLRLVRLSNCHRCGTWICGRLRFALFESRLLPAHFRNVDPFIIHLSIVCAMVISHKLSKIDS